MWVGGHATIYFSNFSGLSLQIARAGLSHRDTSFGLDHGKLFRSSGCRRRISYLSIHPAAIGTVSSQLTPSPHEDLSLHICSFLIML